ncbi:U7 snRNA-associated Sm-like protein LSm11 [Onthophagus taurus]|uniref:U7 snRNA-associated Sm-like protein LSm11 n=1 Tax=Onthophagus taurus TaxID=166361 RepID=UPI0039BE13C5
MAESDCVGVNSSEKCDKNSSDYDASLDFFSEKFDPLKALNTPGLKPPIPGAKIYDNVAKYESVVCKQIKTADRKKCKQTGDQGDKNVIAGNGLNERKWLPHQLPVAATPRNTKAKNNIFIKMENENGPLKILKECIDKRLQIKVITRHSHGIRGFCVGFITMFDKHLNITLEDVFEEWTRPKRRKIPVLNEEFAKMRISKKHPPIPEITIVEIDKVDKKKETCQRRLNGLLLRGENVVAVIVLRNLSG